MFENIGAKPYCSDRWCITSYLVANAAEFCHNHSETWSDRETLDPTAIEDMTVITYAGTKI